MILEGSNHSAMSDPVESFVFAGGLERPPVQLRKSSPFIAPSADLFKAVCAAESGNVVISPFSVLVALSMAAAGSTDGGKNFLELSSFLGHDAFGSEVEAHKRSSEMLESLRAGDPQVDLTLANSLWTQGDVLTDYKSMCAAVFGSEILPLDGALPINKWVSAATKGLIPTLLNQDPKGPAVLLNAVYFKASWTSAFKPELSAPSTFLTFGGSSVPCVMMKKDDKKTRFFESDVASVVLLPYGTTERFVAAVILPTITGQAGMEAAIQGIIGDGHRLEQVVSEAQKSHVVTLIPRFKLSFGPCSLKETLRLLGVR